MAGAAAPSARRWGNAVGEVGQQLADGRFDRVILTGMGGSLHGLHPALLALSQALPIPVLLWETGELTQQVQNIVTERSLVIAVSQSGESGEVRRLTEMAGRPGRVIGVTNQPGNSLANWADLTIPTEAGPELTASTKTYTAGLAALYLLTAHLMGRGDAAGAEVVELSRTVAALLPQMPAIAAQCAGHLGSSAPLTVVARGASYSSAAMAALLIEEAAKLSCEALTGGQFRHGPLELVRAGFRAIVFLGDGEARPLTTALLDRIAELGGRAVGLGTDAGRVSEAVVPITLPATPPGLLPILEIIPIQFLVIPLAIARGFVPAAFLNARKVTTGE